MAGRLTPVGMLTKWLVIPVALLALGYFVIGPQFAGQVAKNLDVAKPEQAEAPAQTPTTDDSARAPRANSAGFPEPDVSVSGRRIGSPAPLDGSSPSAVDSAVPPKPRRRHHRRSSTQKPPAAVEQKPQAQPDPATGDQTGNDLPPADEDGGSPGVNAGGDR